eukprot:TRINITY_DN8970_c0_g1_i1.p1 TRINITY_DN8970_c0_g1~~TRINITY_DN8970_c0_g1_i1.p1  ORF type:complete len:702 (-),score=159.90 TRINITY_DN8970_c0_g1_i1:256-2361(-)
MPAIGAMPTSTQEGDPADDKVFVSGIPPEANADMVLEVFCQWGESVDVDLKVDPATGLNSGYCYVQFDSPETAEQVLENADGFELGNVLLDVKRAADQDVASMSYDDEAAIGRVPAQENKYAGAVGDKAMPPAWTNTAPPGVELREVSSFSDDEDAVTDQSVKAASPLEERHKIFVGGLPQDCSTKVLTSYFSKYGRIINVEVKMDQATGRTRGFGFVQFSSAAVVDQIMAERESHRIEDKWIEVKRAVARDIGGGGGGGGNKSGKGAAGCSGKKGAFDRPAFDNGAFEKGAFDNVAFDNNGYGKTCGKGTFFEGYFDPFSMGGFEWKGADHWPNTKGGGSFGKGWGGKGNAEAPTEEEDKIFVGGLPQNSSREMLVEHFEQYGAVAAAEVKVDSNTGRTRGFGFVQFKDAKAVDLVMADHQNHSIGEKWVDVKRAVPLAPEAPVKEKRRRDAGYDVGCGGCSPWASWGGFGPPQMAWGGLYGPSFGAGPFGDPFGGCPFGFGPYGGGGDSSGPSKGSTSKANAPKGSTSKRGPSKGGAPKGGPQAHALPRPARPASNIAAGQEESDKIFVGGLPQDCTEEKLTAYFSQYGNIVGVEVKIDRDTGRTRGFGFVQFDSFHPVDLIMADYSNHSIDNKWIEVKRAVAREASEGPPTRRVGTATSGGGGKAAAPSARSSGGGSYGAAAPPIGMKAGGCKRGKPY